MNNSMRSDLWDLNDLYDWLLVLGKQFISHKCGLDEHYNNCTLHFYKSFILLRKSLLFPYKFRCNFVSYKNDKIRML